MKSLPINYFTATINKLFILYNKLLFDYQLIPFLCNEKTEIRLIIN